MSNTDFFDDDLVRRDEAAGRSAQPAGEQGQAVEAEEVVSRPVGDLNLTRMARHRDEVDAQVANRLEQLERLRRRKEDIEKEKKDLEDLSRMQAAYEQGKREMVERLKRSIIEFEKAEVRAQRLQELYSELLAQSKTNLSRLQQIDEEAWADGAVREELAAALAVVESTQDDYNQAQAKVEALDHRRTGSADGAPAVFGDADHEPEFERGFGHWVKVGFGVSFPLMVLIILLFVAYLVVKVVFVF
ncbi:MAG: hypothetical protein JXR37_18145 [Kiritimatiellae bacterium]|nr:hypothetical protein [Kiritimatiellia bacterium]